MLVFYIYSTASFATESEQRMFLDHSVLRARRRLEVVNIVCGAVSCVIGDIVLSHDVAHSGCFGDACWFDTRKE